MPSWWNQHGHAGQQVRGGAVQADGDAVWTDMCRRWRAGDRIPAEAYLSGPQAVQGESQIVDLIYGEFCLREELGEEPSAEEYEIRFPRFAREMRRQITVHRALTETGVLRWAAETPHGECASCKSDGAGDTSFVRSNRPSNPWVP
jgi:hypothetical protein